jgi:hypothetical protein
MMPRDLVHDFVSGMAATTTVLGASGFIGVVPDEVELEGRGGGQSLLDVSDERGVA